MAERKTNQESQNYEGFTVRNSIERFCKPHAGFKNDYAVIRTGMKTLDEALGGGIYPGITVLGAKPSIGKSTLALQIAANAASGGTPVLFFSYEMSRDQLAAKMLSRFINEKSAARVTSRELMRGKAEISMADINEDMKKIVQKAENNLFIFSPEEKTDGKKNYMTIKDVFNWIWRIRADKGRELLIIIDYLQYAAMMNRFGGTKVRESVESTLLDLSLRARKDKLPMLIISSVSRSSYKEEPDISMFKESGFIEFSADCLLALYDDPDETPDKEKTPLKLKILKNRYGGVDKVVKLNFYPERDYFIEVGSEFETRKTDSSAPSAKKRKSQKAEAFEVSDNVSSELEAFNKGER